MAAAGKFSVMTTSNGRSGEGIRAQRSAGQWLIGLLIVLALAASVLMVINDDMSLAGSLAVIAALWAAVIAAILVTKFRRQAEGAEAKSRDLRLVYELQLEREIAARRQYELDVESTIRREVADEANHELIDLKHQIASLRASLEVLLGGPLPDQGIALPNERVRQLGSGRMADDLLASQDFAATVPSWQDSRPSTANAHPEEMTEVIPVVAEEEPQSGGFSGTGYPAFGQSGSDVTGDRPAYSAGGYPREFTPAANAHQSYGRQEFPTPAAVAEQPASQDWGAYVASRVAPGRPADVASGRPADVASGRPADVVSGRPDDLESTTIFNRRDFDEDGPYPNDPAATTQLTQVETGRDFDDLGEYAPRQEPESFSGESVDEAESVDDAEFVEDGAFGDGVELLDEDVHCGEPGVDYETTGEPDESGAAEEPGTDDGDFGNDDAFGDDYDTGTEEPVPAEIVSDVDVIADAETVDEQSTVGEAAAEDTWSDDEWATDESAEDQPGYHGSHEASTDLEGFSPGRRRRRRDESGENAHTGGMPVSELLRQLRGEQ